MIRISFDVLVGGFEDNKRTIGVMEICNIKMNNDGTADYAVVLKKTPPFSGALQLAWKKGVVSCNDIAINNVISSEDEDLISTFVNSHHRTKRGIYDLFFRALKACGLDKRNETRNEGDDNNC